MQIVLNQRDLEEGLQRVGAEAEGCFLVILADANKPCLHHQHHEGQGDDRVSDQQQQEGARHGEPAQEEQQADGEHGFRHQHGRDQVGGDPVLAREAVAHQRQRGEDAQCRRHLSNSVFVASDRLRCIFIFVPQNG